LFCAEQQLIRAIASLKLLPLPVHMAQVSPWVRSGKGNSTKWEGASNYGNSAGL